MSLPLRGLRTNGGWQFQDSFARMWKENQGFRLLLLNPTLTSAYHIVSLTEEFKYSKSELLLSSACTLYPAHYSWNPFISSAFYHGLVFILVPSFARLNIYTYLIFSLLLKRTIQTLNNNNKVLYCLNLILQSPGRSPELTLCLSCSRTLSKEQNWDLNPDLLLLDPSISLQILVLLRLTKRICSKCTVLYLIRFDYRWLCRICHSKNIFSVLLIYKEDWRHTFSCSTLLGRDNLLSARTWNASRIFSRCTKFIRSINTSKSCCLGYNVIWIWMITCVLG